ncbi:MAG: hypothetical protein LAP21_23340 [Acidobacteriia bacterium]|nr:hypothetical protein [Terriglobia bacterium]
MKNAPIVLIALALGISSDALAQQPPGVTVVKDGQGLRLLNRPLPDGEPLLLRLNDTLDVRKARNGDAVTAEVLRSLQDGGIRTPGKAVLIGHLTQVAPFSKRQGRSTLGIVFDQIRLPDGSTRPFSGMIQALGVQPENPSEICYPREDPSSNSTYDPCSPIPGPVELTAETVGIFDLDDSFDPFKLLQEQLVVSKRHNVKLRAGTRIVVRGQIKAAADKLP